MSTSKNHSSVCCIWYLGVCSTVVVSDRFVCLRLNWPAEVLRGQANLRQKAGNVTTFQMYRRYTYDSLLERDGRPVNDPVFFLVYFYVYKKIHTFKNHGYRSKHECVVHFEATFWTIYLRFHDTLSDYQRELKYCILVLGSNTRHGRSLPT